jgi:hypothetical protein
MLKPFDEQDAETLRLLGFTISVTHDGERAVVEGKSKIEIWRSSEDQVY